MWRTGLIMVDAVNSGTLDACHEMRQHSMRYTPSTWVLQCEADVRAAPAAYDALGTGHCGLSSRTRCSGQQLCFVLAQANRLSEWVGGDAAVRGSGNRRGRKLCRKWQGGQCKPCVQGGVACPRDRGAAHQCARCSSSQHEANFPQPCTAAVAKQPKGKRKERARGQERRQARVTPS